MIDVEDIRRVLIVGAGAIGRQIGIQCARAGYPVTLQDVQAAALNEAAVECRSALRKLVDRGELGEREFAGCLRRLHYVGDPSAAAAEADLLIECVPERLALKREVFKRFAGLCPPHTIFTTNTSMLLPSMLASASGRPERFAALHFIMTSDMIEIMPHARTAPETLVQLEAFADRVAPLAIVCRREQPGYVVNTMLMALNSAALSLVVNGVATFEDVDRSWMKAFGVDFGPFGTLDVVGIDTAWEITEQSARWYKSEQTLKNAAFLKDYVDAGRLGVKSGRGFYDYPDPAYRQPGFCEQGSGVHELNLVEMGHADALSAEIDPSGLSPSPTLPSPAPAGS